MTKPSVSELPLEVSCQLIGAMLEICDEYGVDPDELCTDLPYDPAHLADPKQWIDWHTLAELTDRFEARSGLRGPDFARAAAKLVDGPGFRSALALARLVISPAAHTRWYFRHDGLFRRLYPVLETDFHEHADGQGFEWSIQITQPGYPLPAGFFWAIQGQGETFIRRLGARDAVVEIREIERGYHYVARYRSRSLMMRMRQVLTWPWRARDAQRMLEANNAELLERLVALEAEVRRRERTEEQLHQRIVEAETLQLQLDRSQRLNSLGLVAGGVAHDFNNLLTGILGYAELAAELATEESFDADELASYVEGITKAAERAGELTRQLLTFGRRGETKTRRCTLGPLVGETVQLLRRLLPRTIEVAVELPDPGSEPELLLDRGQLQQVIMNLALNARDAMPEGGHLDLRVDAVELTQAEFGANPHALAPGPFARLEVRDDGVGITVEDLDQIFDPFFTTKAEGEGTGLGLSLVFGIVRRHGGTVEVRSEPGAGTRFVVFLPAASPDALASARELEARGPGPHGSGCILLVDDDVLVCRVAERHLASAGYELVVAHDGEAALAEAEAAPRRFCLVFSDLAMPRRSGISLTRALRRRWPTLPILVATGYVRDPNALTELASLGVPVLHKPYVRDELLWAVHDAKQ